MQRRDDHKRSATMCDVFEKAQLTGLRNPSRKRSTRGFGGDFQNRVRRQGKSLGNVHFSKRETKPTICGELVNYPENPRLSGRNQGCLYVERLDVNKSEPIFWGSFFFGIFKFIFGLILEFFIFFNFKKKHF